MEFRTCPACQASVLEDDAVDCPFCGASMTSGKPAATAKPKPAAAAPVKAAPASPAPTPGKPKGSAAPPKKKAEPTDPFEVDTSAARKATPVRPRPAKGYMLRVTCPMCEKPGFISQNEVGKEVRCCNPECLVPVFVANPPREKEPEPEPVESGSGRMYWLAAIGVLAIGVGAAVPLMLNRKPPSGTGPILQPTPKPLVSDGETGDPEANANRPPQPPAALTMPEVIAKSLEGIRVASQGAQNQRERALATRILAESLVETGSAAKAKEELASLAGPVKYMAIVPLTMEAWRQVDAGRSATAVLEEAFALRSTLPKQGRDALDAVSQLASALAASGRMDDARELAESHNDPNIGQLSALWRGAVDGGAFRIDQLTRRACLQDLPHPQWAGVTQTLAGHRRYDEARAWALAAPDSVVRDNCCAVLAAQLAADLGAGEALTTRLGAITESLDAAGRVRVWCAAGQGLLERGDRAGASEWAAKAADGLVEMPKPTPVTLPPLADLYALADSPGRGLPDPHPHHSAALAAMDLFVLQSQLGGGTAFIQVERALEFSSGIAPVVHATGAILREIEQAPAAVRRRFAETLMIDDNVAVARFSRYQTQVKAWHERGLERLALEIRMLTRAALLGEAAAVWNLAKQSDADGRQSYQNTTIPGLILELARVDRLETLQQEVAAAFSKTPPILSATDAMLVALRANPELKDWNNLRQQLRTYLERREPDQYRVSLAVLSQLTARLDADPADTLRLATELPDPLLSEDALWLIAARGTKTGHARPLLDSYDGRKFPSTTSLAVYRGFIDGATGAGTEGKP